MCTYTYIHMYIYAAMAPFYSVNSVARAFQQIWTIRSPGLISTARYIYKGMFTNVEMNCIGYD